MERFVELGRAWNADLIFFLPLNNWGTYTPHEYEARAIHRNANIEHEIFVEYLRTAPLLGADVELGAFAGLL